MFDCLVIGVAGGTGSGKTTLARKLHEAYPEDSIILSHDYYYKNNISLPFEERCKLNYDHPDAFDTYMIADDIASLKCGETIHHPTYDFTVHLRREEKTELQPKKIVIVEGILIFENKSLRDLFDIKVFVDTDADVRFIRRLLRDTTERKRSVESVISQYLGTVKPMHEQFIEPSKKYADIIIPEGGHNAVAVNMLLDTIKKYIDEL